LQGTLAMLILRTLQWGPSHGYGIVQALRTQSGEILQLETGSLYPALHRLERRGWVTSDWKRTESNQCARCYSLTVARRKELGTIWTAGNRWWMCLGAFFTGNLREARHEFLAILGVVVWAWLV